MQKFKMILGVWMWVVVLLWGCQNKVKKSNLEMIPVDMDRAREVGVSDVFSEIELVPLETSENNLMGSVFPMVYRNRYFMRHNQPEGVSCFNSSGHFLYRIHQQGRGENEYRGINGMAGNPYLPVLYLNESLDYLHLFELSGHFREKIRLDAVREIIHGIVPLNRDTLIVISGRYNYTYTFYSLSERCVITQKRDHLPLAGSPSHFFRVEDQVFYAPAFESVVYEVRDTAFVPAFCFDFGKYNNDLSALADFDRVIVDDREMEDFLNRNFNSFINKMWGSRDYLCLMMSCKVKGDWENRFLFLDRNTREYIVATDFIESFPFSPFGDFVDDRFIFPFTPMELKEGNLSDLFDEQSKAAYQKIKLDDNPVILKARLKI